MGSHFGDFILCCDFGESFGLETLQFPLGGRLFGVFRVVVIAAVAGRCLVTVAPAVVGSCVLARTSGITVARSVLRVVVVAAVTRRVLVAVAPTVVIVIEINTGALLRIPGTWLVVWSGLGTDMGRRRTKGDGGADQGE